VARIFEIKLLHLLGLMPTLEFCVHCTGPAGAMNRFSMRLGGLLCKNCFSADKDAVGIMPGTVNFIEHIRSSAFERVARVKVAARVGEELEGILRRFLDYHIERRMNTVSFIREVEGS
jgi:DNA repair protein RecO (recombination protein O)